MCVEKEMIQQTAERLGNAVNRYTHHAEQEEAIGEAIAAGGPVSPHALRHELSVLATRNDGVADENQGALLAAALQLVYAKQATDACTKKRSLEEANSLINSFYERVDPKGYRQIRKAKDKFGQFIKELNPCPPGAIGPDGVDPPTYEPLQVSRTEALDVFLSRHPQFDCHREHLAVVRLESPTFRFRKDLWERLTSGA